MRSSPEASRLRLESELRYVLSLVNEWLRFGETKNGALLAANLSLAVAALKLESPVPALACWAPWAAALFLVSALVGLVAFKPRTSIPRMLVHRAQEDDAANPLFFGYAATCSPSGYLEQLRSALGEADCAPLPIHEQFAQQIVTNSRIAVLKHTVFWWAMWVTVSGLITPLGAVALYVATTQVRGEE